MHHLCGHAEIGSYTGQVELVPPPALARADGRGICVDVCLSLEITKLWQRGIITTGCCCGHGVAPPFIGVRPDYIYRMKAMGYVVQPNPMRPGAEDSFVPKTEDPLGLEEAAVQSAFGAIATEWKARHATMPLRDVQRYFEIGLEAYLERKKTARPQ